MHVISSVLLEGALYLWSSYSEWTLPEQSLCNKQDWYDSLKACCFMNASFSVWVPGSGCSLLDEWKLRFLLSFVCVCARTYTQKTSHFLCGSQVLPPIFLFDFKHFSPCVTGILHPKHGSMNILDIGVKSSHSTGHKSLGMKAYPSHQLALCKGKQVLVVYFELNPPQQ